jgi:hypothetical protein
LYVSWNGATEVREWRLLAGPDKVALRPVLSVPKSGFETAIPLRGTGTATWVAAQALDDHDRSLARSPVVRVP